MESFQIFEPIYDLIQRAELYNKAFPKYSEYAPLVFTTYANEHYIYGCWIIGANYSNKTNFYGEYPRSYLKRIQSIFPDCKKILHCFSGSLDSSVIGDRFDINPEVKPDILGNAESLSELVNKKYDIIYADPPYSVEDAEHYGTPLINRNKVVNECSKILKINGYLVWLDQIFPMYSNKDLKLIGTILLIRSTNHRVRSVFIYQKINKN
jgi:hypothetical protein